MRRHVLLLALLILAPALPAAWAAASPSATPTRATGPDAEGAWVLSYDVQRDAPAHVTLSLDVLATDAGTTHGTRALKAMDLAAGLTSLNVSFLPAEGPGDYTVSLVVDGAASAPLAFHVEGSHGATAMLAFSVPEEPTYLNLTSDSVNADGKLKAVGDEIITRATLHHGNGLGNLDPALRWVVDAPGYHGEGSLALPATPSSTDASIEHRWHDSPLPNATYRLTLSATRHGVAVANASRTFVIKLASSTFVPLSIANVTPDADTALPVDVLVANRNGAPGAGTLEAKLYRGSSAAAGFSATFANGNAITDLGAGERHGVSDDGSGLTRYPLVIYVPAGAAPGQIRLSLLLNGATFGSGTFNVLALPTLSSVAVAQQGDNASFEAQGTGEGILRLELRDGDAKATLDAPFSAGSARAMLVPPTTGRTFSWNATLLASPNGTPLATRAGTWTRATPNITLTLASGLPRLPASWTVASPGWNLAQATVNLTVLRWDGTTEPNLTARFDGATAILDGPATLAPGRYTLQVRVTYANGTSAFAATSFDAGPWIRISLGAPALSGREARLSLVNEGGVLVKRIVVESEDNLTVSLQVKGVTVPSRISASGRLIFDALSLAPGDSAQIVARLPEGPQPSGTRTSALRVLALPGGS